MEGVELIELHLHLPLDEGLTNIGSCYTGIVLCQRLAMVSEGHWTWIFLLASAGKHDQSHFYSTMMSQLSAYQ